MTDSEKAKQIISENIYATIATADRNSKPWISPVFFAFDNEYNLYWVSNKESHHSKNISANPDVAIVIFNSQASEGDGDGVYLECVAKELTDENELANAIEVYNQRATQDDFRVKDVASVSGDNLWRLYSAVPQRVSKLSDGEVIKGQYVDKRIEVSL